MKFTVFFLVFFSHFSFAQNLIGSDWKLKKVEKEISVYTKDLENSNIKEIRAVFQLKTRLSSIVALLNDSESFPQWAFRCGQCTTLKQISSHEFLRYQTVIAPWPVDDRDFVVKVRVSQDALTKVVVQQITAVSNIMSKVRGKVRIVIFKGIWTLTPLQNGTVHIDYQLLLDPGGNIPAWLINLSASDGPIQNAIAMKEWLQKDKYKNAKLEIIQEP